MDNTKKLLQNTAIIALGKLSTQVISFFLLPVYTGILTTGEYGDYDLVTTLNLFLVPFITLLMEESMFRFLIDAETEQEKENIISATFLYCIFSSIIFSLIVFIIGEFFFNYKYTYYLVFFIITSVSLGLSNSLSRGLGNIKLYSFTNFFASFLMILFNILFIVVFHFGIKGMLTSYILSNAISSFFSLNRVRVCRYLSFNNFNKVIMKNMLKYSFPLVPNSISWVIMNLSDRLIITATIGNSGNGIYSISNKFPNLMNTFYGFFYTAWKESASKAIKQENSSDYYNFIYRNLKRIMISIALLLIAVMPFVFNILINIDYSEAYMYIPILTLSMYFSNISGFYGGIFAAQKDTRIMGTTTIWGAALNLVINIILIKYLGLYAAAFSTLISNIITYFMRYKYILKYEKFEKDTLLYITSIIIGTIVLIIYYQRILILNILSLILAAGFAFVINRDTIKFTLLKLNKK